MLWCFFGMSAQSEFATKMEKLNDEPADMKSPPNSWQGWSPCSPPLLTMESGVQNFRAYALKSATVQFMYKTLGM